MIFFVLVLVRLERERNRKKMAHRVAVLRKDSQIAEHYRKIEELQRRLMDETDKLTMALTELSSLRKVRSVRQLIQIFCNIFCLFTPLMS